MRHWILCFGLLSMCMLAGSCAFHKTADEWNSLVGPTGEPVYLNSTTKVGFRLLVFLPFVGRVNLDGMVAEATEEIRADGGDFLRVVQSNEDNYWYALPPITWIVTPVVHTLVVEYRPLPQPDWMRPTRATRPPPDLYPAQRYEGSGTRR